ncbi:MAG: hypothetical protein ACUVTW_13285 [Thermogutta sp.]
MMLPLSHDDRPNVPAEDFRGIPDAAGEPNFNFRASDPTEKPLGWSVVAARIAAWTSRMLVSFLVIAAALVFTSQILRWWRTPPTVTLTAITAPPQDIGNAAEWIDADWTTTWYTASGPEDEVTHDLARRMLQATSNAAIPADGPNEKERSVLRHLTEREPFLKDGSGAAVFRLNQALPIWLGVRSADGGDSAEFSGTETLDSIDSADTGPSRTAVAVRIVAWGFLVPLDGDLWRIALAVSGAPSAGQRPAPEIALPAGAQPGFTLRFGDGSMLQAFRGEHADKSAWMAHFDAWLEDRGWSADTKWQVRQDEAVRHYRRPSRSEDSVTDVGDEFLLVTLRDEAGATRGFLMSESSALGLAGPGDAGGHESDRP